MQDENHKKNHKIIGFVIDYHISVVRLAPLTNIKQKTKTNRKDKKNLHA